LLLPTHVPTEWGSDVGEAAEFIRDYTIRERKNATGNLRRDWRHFMTHVSHLVRHGVLPPSIIMDPSIPIFPKNKIGWAVSGSDDQFATLLQEVDEREPHRVWYWRRPLRHPFWTQLVTNLPKYHPAASRS